MNRRSFLKAGAAAAATISNVPSQGCPLADRVFDTLLRDAP